MKRTDFLSHVGWTGGGILFGIASSGTIATAAASAATFVQISDSHIGFKQTANPDVAGTLQAAVARINALAPQPAFVMHTGDLTHLAKPEQFDDVKRILGTLRAPYMTIPGEHDTIGGGIASYQAMFGRRGSSEGWYSFDRDGIHYIALVNVFNFEKMGLLGTAQLDWLRRDLASMRASTPLVVFSHAPLYALFPQWGWTTEDGTAALALLSRFEAVSVLSGHIHQIVTHEDRNVRFFTAAATAYPQPAPGSAEKPGPLTVPPDHLLATLGYRTVAFARGRAAVIDRPLSEG